MLARILARKNEEIAILKKEYTPDYDAAAPLPGRFAAAVKRPAADPVGVIAEVKKASPSRGVLCPDFDPAALGRIYGGSGACAVSVLTDRDFFQGDPAYVQIVKKTARVPVLRKDFILDEIQLYQAREIGADAVLLIAAALDYRTLLALTERSHALGLDVLVEAHNAEEVYQALDTPARLIGVNNRNLSDFTVDLATSLELGPIIPSTRLKVSESGIKSPEDMLQLESAGFAAALVGETLVTATDPGRALAALTGYREAIT